MSQFLIKNLLFFMISVPGSLIVFFVFLLFYKYSKWEVFDLLSLVIPIQLHSLLIEFTSIKNKGTGNDIGEPIYLGIIFVIVIIIRAILGKLTPDFSKKYALYSFIFMIAFAIAIYFIVPDLGE